MPAANFPLGDQFKSGPVEVIGFDAAFGRRAFAQQRLEHAPRLGHGAVILADTDTELDDGSLGVPSTCYHYTIMAVDLAPADRAALVALLKETIAADRFPVSPRIRTLKRILDKLEPPSQAGEPPPAPKPPGERSAVLARKRRR